MTLGAFHRIDLMLWDECTTVSTKGKYSAAADGHVKAFAIFDHINITDVFVSYNVVLALFQSFVH